MIHTMCLFLATDTTERFPNDMQSSSKMLNIGPVIQPPKTWKQLTKGNDQSSNEVWENQVIFTEMGNFVWNLQFDEDTHKIVIEEDDKGPSPVKQGDVAKTVDGWTKVK